MNKYDVVIVGGGVTGAATLHLLANYTDVKKVALIEKYDKLASVNSSKDHNSQTLHFGDIETNYTVEKAAKVKKASDRVRIYVEKHKDEGLHRKSHKMVLAVGREEIEVLEKRAADFKKLFPKNRFLSRKEIVKIEPMLVKGRGADVPLAAYWSPDGYAIDYGMLAESLAKHSGEADVFLGEQVCHVKRKGKLFEIKTKKQTMTSKVVLVTAGPHSLTFAHKLGYGLKLILLPVAGSFYRSPKMVNGKVYMMQLAKLPFAAIHADPDVHNPDETRYGPTAKVLPMMERYNYGSMREFFKLFRLRWDASKSLFVNVFDPVYMKYMSKQLLFDVPLIGKLMFIKQVRKIVPSIKLSQLTYGKGLGGVRPQIIDTRTHKIELGSAKIQGKNCLFDVTPSPGASVCLMNAEENTRMALKFLGGKYRFQATKFKREFCMGGDC